VIAALLHPGSAMQRALSVAPLPWIGRLSYGAYIYHWPIFLFLTEERTGLPAVPLFAVRTVLTIACAWVSLRLVEQPVRARRALGARRAIFAASLAAPLALAAPVWIERALPDTRPVDTRADEATRGLGRQPRIAGFGDSTALVLAFPLEPWLKEAGMLPRRGRAQLGCSLVQEGAWYFQTHWKKRPPKRCADALRGWEEQIEDIPIDIAYVLIGPWDVLTRRFTRNDSPRALGDPLYDTKFRHEIDRAVEMFAEHGTGVIWITSPPASFNPKPWVDAERFREASDPKRMERLNELIREAAGRWPDHLRIADFARYLERAQIDLSDESVRHDGVHFTPEALAEIVDDWLGPEIVRHTEELVPLLRRPAESPP